MVGEEESRYKGKEVKDKGGKGRRGLGECACPGVQSIEEQGRLAIVCGNVLGMTPWLGVGIRLAVLIPKSLQVCNPPGRRGGSWSKRPLCRVRVAKGVVCEGSHGGRYLDAQTRRAPSAWALLGA